MITAIRALKRHARTKLDQFNILSLSYDGAFEDFLVETGHQIYEVDFSKAKEEYKHSDRVGLFKYIADKGKIHIQPPNHIDIDIILCHCLAQIEAAVQISRILSCPLMYIDHDGSQENNIQLQENVHMFVSMVAESKYYLPNTVQSWKQAFTQIRNQRLKFK